MGNFTMSQKETPRVGLVQAAAPGEPTPTDAAGSAAAEHHVPR